jgi:hypothetical protein
MKDLKVKKEHSQHKKLLKMLSKHFNQDESEMADEESENDYPDYDDDSEGGKDFYEDREENDSTDGTDGFGDPMSAFGQKKSRNNTPRRRPQDKEEPEMMGDEQWSNDGIDDMEDDKDDPEKDNRPTKEHRKNLAMMTISKKIGKGKAKKM